MRKPCKRRFPELTELAETIGKKANATAVFGSPIVDGDRTVIPVAQARFALAWRWSYRQGFGGGMTAKPLGFIVIDKNGVRFQKTPQPSLAPLAIGVVWARARDAADAAAEAENCASRDASARRSRRGGAHRRGISRAAPGIESQ